MNFDSKGYMTGKQKQLGTLTPSQNLLEDTLTSTLFLTFIDISSQTQHIPCDSAVSGK